MLNGLVDGVWRPVTPVALAAAGLLIAFGVLGGDTSQDATENLNRP
ncbi:hypothetical protein [Lentzea guizhouensis]|nr:hypothetical protein [Lentzea guizhouensis]